MKATETPELPEMAEKGLRALRRAAAKVVQEHKLTGEPLVIEKDGRAQFVPPDEVDAPELGDPLPQSVAEEAAEYETPYKSLEKRVERLEEQVERLARERA